MEPILAKADNYSFLKKLVENVKQTRDAQAPDDEEVNKVHEQRSLQQDNFFLTEGYCAFGWLQLRSLSLPHLLFK